MTAQNTAQNEVVNTKNIKEKEQHMKFETINDCLDSFMDGYSFSEAVLDAINASRTSKQALENLFDQTLWVDEEFSFENDEIKRYYITLGAIEEKLVVNNLIYN